MPNNNSGKMKRTPLTEYKKLVILVDSATAKQVTEGFLYYFDTYEKDLKNTFFNQLSQPQSLNLDERKDLLKDFCAEIINQNRRNVRKNIASEEITHITRILTN